jgi:hypothetical protein
MMTSDEAINQNWRGRRTYLGVSDLRLSPVTDSGVLRLRPDVEDVLGLRLS